MKNLVAIVRAETRDLPYIDRVSGERLPSCIAAAHCQHVEVAARLQYWRRLNQPYRQNCRRHRDAEEAATNAAWEAANPCRRTWWDSQP